MIEFQNVYKSYGVKPVLADFNMKIAPAEFVTMTGVSGSGKTTVLKLLTLEERVNDGDILIEGQTLLGLDKDLIQAYRRKIGVVFQDYRLLESRTAEENIQFTAEIVLERDDVTEEVNKIMEKTNLMSVRGHYPHELSGGEMQRVAFARAVIHDPSLLLVDEPTGNLDEENTKELLELLIQAHKAGTTILLATHDPYLIARVPGRVIRI